MANLDSRTSREQCFSGLQKAYLRLGGSDGIQLAISGQAIGCIIRVQDRSKQRREIGLLPQFGGRFVSIVCQYVLNLPSTHLSPLKSNT